MLDPLDKIPDARKAKPKRLEAGFSVTFSGDEAAEHSASPDDFAQRGRCFRDGFLGQEVCAFPLLVAGLIERTFKRPSPSFAPENPSIAHVLIAIPSQK